MDSICLSPSTTAERLDGLISVHRGHAHEPRDASSGSDTDDVEVRAGVRPDDRAAGCVYGGGKAGGSGDGVQWYVEAQQTVICRARDGIGSVLLDCDCSILGFLRLCGDGCVTMDKGSVLHVTEARTVP